VAAIALIAVAALLFLGYLRESWTVTATSDGAALARQANDMLAGNWLLHGWTLGDVSFYTTELPEYMLVELIRPFGVGVIHVAAAATYTLLVLAAFWLARGRVGTREGRDGGREGRTVEREGQDGMPEGWDGGREGRAGRRDGRAGRREGLTRGALAGLIMVAPQLGYGAFVLLLSPDHVGTEVPLLIGWLLLDVAPRRWWVPTGLCLLLALVQFADRAALLTAVVPLILVGGVTAARGRRLAGRWDRECRFELALVAAGVLSVGLAWEAARLLSARGGFAAHPVALTLAPLSLLWTHIWLTGCGILELYGANFIGVTGWAGVAFAALHLVGLTLAIAAVAVALGRFLRPRSPRLGDHVKPNAHLGRQEPAQTRIWAGTIEGGAHPGVVDSVLAVAVVVDLVSYVLSMEPGTVLGTGYGAREIAAVLPLGAVLAGRIFGAGLAERVAGWRRDWVRWGGGAETTVRSISSGLVVLAVFLVVAGYLSAFGYSAAQGSAAGRYSVLADWLAAHGLRYGLSDGPAANVLTVDSGGRVTIEPTEVRAGRVSRYLYQSSAAAFDLSQHDANFLITQMPNIGAAYAPETVPYPAVLATFGPPARTYRFDGYTVLTWNVNLLTRLHH
jgi:hypothetical protein